MAKNYGLSNSEFQEIQKRFLKSSPEERKAVTDNLISVLYEDFHGFVQRKSKPVSIRTTDIANSFCSRLLQQYAESNSALKEFSTLDDYMRYNIRAISNFIIDRIRKESVLPTSLNEITAPTSDDETDGFDPSEDQSLVSKYGPDYIAREAANELMKILNTKLTQEEKDVLALRYGLNILLEPNVNGEWNSPAGMEEETSMKYTEIAKALGDDVTPDAVRMHHNRLINELRDTPAIILLAEEFGFQIEPENKKDKKK